MTEPELSWIRKVKQAAIDTGAIPLSGFPPPFPWQELSKQLASSFQTPELAIEVKEVVAASADELLKGLSANTICTPIHLTPIEGQAFFVMEREEMLELTALTLKQEGFLSTTLQEGFYHYLCTQVAALLNQLQAFNDLYIQVDKATTLPQEESLLCDLQISCAGRSLFARLICPSTFHSTFKAHFAQKPPELHPPLMDTVKLCASLCVAETKLSLRELKAMHPHDFLLLDRCSWDPETKKGTADLQLSGKSLFRLRIKGDHLKVLNPTTQEEDFPMDSNEEDPVFDQAHELDKIESEAKEEEEKEHLWASDETPPTEEKQEEEGISTEQIPLTLTVEVGKVHLSLSELLNLSVGNTIDLSVKPEQGVNLTVGGKTIAKAELIKIGDLLGVRILKLYSK